ncbi:MAG: glycosyltransferase [Acidobacteria bacterium]|nr:glycosyltransferase [Acidobacteriota bacterium]
MEALAGLYVLLFVVRFGLALWHAARKFGLPGEGGPAAILQPILSGDPLLGTALAANARELTEERLYWLVDEDDPKGQDAARAAAKQARLGNVWVIVGPGPQDGENPKVAKLARVDVSEEVTVVLDDDTRIRAAELGRLRAALEEADLVTGLPVFVSTGTVYERFVGGFVNGNAMLTYLPAAAVGAQHTINGMIYAVRTAELRELGGFAAIREQLTDDYAMAQLYERSGRRILQTAVCVDVGMTIRDAAHCARVMRRWFLFANRYLGDNLGAATLVLVALPSVLPLAGLVFGWPWIALLFGKAVGNRWLLWYVAGRASGPLDLVFEVLADLLSPFFYVAALIRPRELSWRSRKIAMDGDRIRYR